MGELSRVRSAFMITALVVMWGVSWPLYKIALDYTPPVLFAGMRCLLGGLLLVLYALPRFRAIRWKQTWYIYVIAGLFNAVLFFSLQTIGLEYMASGLFSVIVYLQPVLVGIFAWVWLGENMSLLKITGLVLGFIGVACISLESMSGQISVIGILLALGSALSWAFGTIYTKKVGSKTDFVWLVALQFFIGGVITTVFGMGIEDWTSISPWHAGYLAGLLYGGIFGVAIAWLFYFGLVNAGEASKVASFTFIVPMISVLAGTIFLNEPFTFNLLLGILFIVFAIYLVNRPSRKRAVVNRNALKHTL